jgi:hypothetical protein
VANRVLIVGWFSLDGGGGATAGDLEAAETVRRWCLEVGQEVDVALADAYAGGVRWDEIPPERYDRLAFVCGPVWGGSPVARIADRFPRARVIGLGVSIPPLHGRWARFDDLVERDGALAERLDLSFFTEVDKPPVLGRIVVHPQSEYGIRSCAHEAAQLIDRALSAIDATILDIDTALAPGSERISGPGSVEALIARTDLVVTTRMHGLVLALKNGVPAVAIDPVAGGAKVSAQARVVGWPFVGSADAVDEAWIRSAVAECSTDDARRLASERATAALAAERRWRDLALSALSGMPSA